MFVGLDLGTSGLRAILMTSEGEVIAEAEAAYSVSRPASGWSEQDPSDWLEALAKVMGVFGQSAPDEFSQVKALALSGHMHGATLVDANGAVLRPCILWNDTRSADQAARLDATQGFRALTGNIVFPGFTAPKLMWVAEHEPDVFARIDKVLLPKDYVVFALTGRAASEMSDAAGTSWLDVGRRAWSETLLEATGLTLAHMPELFEGTEVVREILSDRAAELGLPPGVLVVAGAGDNAAAACGIGALAEGDGFVSLGTSGVLLAARDGFHPMAATAVHSFCHAIPERWYQMGVILAATDSLNWLGKVVGKRPAALTDALGTAVKAPNAVRFLPYLSGERTPHNDSAVRGAFLHLDIAGSTEDLTQAVIEGVSFALRDSLDALRSAGADPTSLIAIGGGTGSRYWTEALATCLGVPLRLPAKGEFGAAMGAARLAQCGATGAAPEAIMTAPAIAETIDPIAELQPAFEHAHAAFRDSYAVLKSMPEAR